MRKLFVLFAGTMVITGAVQALDQPSYSPGTQQFQDQKTQDQKYQNYNLQRGQPQVDTRLQQQRKDASVQQQRLDTQIQEQRIENQRLDNQRMENRRLDNQRADQRRDDNRRASNNNYGQNGIADASMNSTMKQTVDKDSDEGRIIDAIQRDLKRDKSLSTNAQHVDIAVNNKNVTLRGTVDTKEEKARVESIAKDAFGVRSVNNQLQIANYETTSPKK